VDFLIDTHVWVWWIGRITRLPNTIMDALDQAPQRPLLSVASLWELSILVESGQIELGPTVDKWLDIAADSRTVRLAQVTTSVARELFHFPKRFPRDPADRIIVATARAFNMPLLTYDGRIRRSGLVQLWKP
jgi:PIN domain nuclease of toxin-antitoxin system